MARNATVASIGSAGLSEQRALQLSGADMDAGSMYVARQDRGSGREHLVDQEFRRLSSASRSCDRDGGVSRLLQPGHKRRKLISGTAKNRKQVVDEAGHAARVGAKHEIKAYDDNPPDCPAQGY